MHTTWDEKQSRGDNENFFLKSLLYGSLAVNFWLYYALSILLFPVLVASMTAGVTFLG